MIRSKHSRRLAIALFLFVETVLGVLLQITPSSISYLFSFSSIVLACLFCLTLAERRAAYICTQLALVCTACADYFLLFPIRRQLLAMIFFSFVQLFYFFRLFSLDKKGKRRCIHLLLRIFSSAFALLLTAVVLGEKTDTLALMSLFYYANLLLNIVFAFLSFRRAPFFAIGLLFFGLCDTVVGFECMAAYLPIAEDSFFYRITHLGFNLAWVFYLPAQAILAISTLKGKETER